jgi:uncharacterized protein YcfJ
VLGGVVGGVVGAKSSEENRTVAIILGTAAGALIGSAIGRELDEADRGCVAHALEIGKGWPANHLGELARRSQLRIGAEARAKSMRDGPAGPSYSPPSGATRSRNVASMPARREPESGS